MKEKILHERSLKWKICNSLWIVFSFVFLGGIGFIIAGMRAKQKKWIGLGILYFLAMMLIPFISSYGVELGVTYNGWRANIVLVWFFIWFWSIIHSFLILKRYLIKVDEITKRNVGRQNIATEATTVMAEEKRIDINNCSVEELDSLVGMSIVMAKKADEYRTAHGGFSSVDEFYEVTGLKPHFIVQMQDKIFCGNIPCTNQKIEKTLQQAETGAMDVMLSSEQKRGRILDL